MQLHDVGGGIVIDGFVVLPPKPPEGAAIVFYLVDPECATGKTGQEKTLKAAVEKWIRYGTGLTLVAIAHRDLGCVDGTSSQDEFESEWDGMNWSEWNTI